MSTSAELPDLAVTGSTGALGGMVARTLAGQGVQQRLLARTPSRAPDLGGAVVLPASYADRQAATRALDGVRVLFMVSAADAADRLDQHRAFIDAAAEAGVRHIVYTSFCGAAPDSVFTLGRDHYATEQHIKDTGIAHTFLRDNFYIDFLPALAGDDGVIRGPAGDGRVAAVTRADIARAAVAVLTDPDAHLGATYRLTGPQALTMAEVAATISDVTGQHVTFHNETVAEAYQSRRKWGAPAWQTDAWVSTYTAIAAGEVDGVTDDVKNLTGRRPRSLATFLTARLRLSRTSTS
ncbi:MAG TPA: SDR family oxidoreductase [Jatrophihabitans sp.]|uniref:SDR family oxidoreductase n=1 Tax=Jatrophihabitans sp. TaxID=1932789 RepID=UPI002EE6B7A0